MPVSHVKQLWPWFSAKNARLWVLQNLFGGRVVDANLQFQVVPGRLGNGVPLSADEVFGRFQIEGSRFDTAGRIPPIRDAVGVVAFHGNDVDIALSSGSVYMPSGRTVAASNGTLAMKAANHPPVIGALDIDVAGEAPAIAELASYEPINAMRHVGLLPDDLSGDGDRPRQGRHSAAVRRRYLEARLAGVARLQGPVARQAVRRPDGDRCRRFDRRSGPTRR